MLTAGKCTNILKLSMTVLLTNACSPVRLILRVSTTGCNKCRICTNLNVEPACEDCSPLKVEVIPSRVHLSSHFILYARANLLVYHFCWYTSKIIIYLGLLVLEGLVVLILFYIIILVFLFFFILFYYLLLLLLLLLLFSFHAHHY